MFFRKALKFFAYDGALFAKNAHCFDTPLKMEKD